MNLSSHSEMFQSSLDVMSTDGIDLWPNDPSWKKIFRHLRILPPHPNERPEKRNARLYIWAALLLDFVAALVSILTYHGVAKCCGDPMLSLVFVNGNWTHAIRIVTYVYMALILVEIIPVVRKGIPLNLLNP
jgi:hypothetical protein